MRVIARILLIALTILVPGIQFIFTQTAASQTGGTIWPLEVKEFQVSLVNVVSQTSSGGTNMPINSMPGTMSVPDMVKAESKQLLLTLKCRNTASKPTSVIYWESRFSDTSQHLVIKQFKSKKKIKPGKDEMIEEPLQYDTNLIPNNIKMGFRIVKVEYADNTTWDECTKDIDSCFVWKNYTLQ